MLERLADDVLRADPLHPQLRLQRQAVCQRRYGNPLHVVRRREIAALERGATAGELQQREGPTWTGADLEPLTRASRAHQLDDVAAERVGDVHFLDRPLHLEQRLA